MRQAADLPAKPQGYPEGRNHVNNRLLASIKREVPGCPESGGRGTKRLGGGGVTRYRFGKPKIRHVHDGLAESRLPREVREELVQSGRDIPTPRFRTAGQLRATGARPPKTCPEP